MVLCKDFFYLLIDGETYQGDMPTSCVFLVDMAAQHSEKHGDGWSWLDWELVESVSLQNFLIF